MTPIERILPRSARDWPADFGLENGGYLSRCFKCGAMFTGHKDRVACRACHEKASAEFASLAPVEQIKRRIASIKEAEAIFTRVEMKDIIKPVEICGALYVAPSEPVNDDLVAELHALPWLSVRDARQEYFMSLQPREYSYGNRGTGSQTYKSNDFSPLVLRIMANLNAVLHTDLNVCFLNKYDNEKHHLGWHADDFPGMRADQPIVVASFGAEREIWLKDKRGFLVDCTLCVGHGVHPTPIRMTRGNCPQCLGAKKEWQKSPPNDKQPLDQRVLLQNGSLFIMPPGYQDTHLHRIPKHDRPCGWRISLTFRSFT